MKQTDMTLLTQMRMSDFEIANRKSLCQLYEQDVAVLRRVSPVIEANLEQLVTKFYQQQTDIPEIANLIGDADSLLRLARAQKTYIEGLFSGCYDLEYVNNRLRIGLVHKRIGVEPKLYLAAIYSLKSMLTELIESQLPEVLINNDLEPMGRDAADKVVSHTLKALEKLLMFDITLVFDTYISGMVGELKVAMNKAEHYAQMLEHKVNERTKELELLARTDSLTGLNNTRYLYVSIANTIGICRKLSQPVAMVFISVDEFKQLNSIEGHLKGDEVIVKLGNWIKDRCRQNDIAFRYSGAEFCIMLPNCREEHALELFDHKLNVEHGNFWNKLSLNIGAVHTGPRDYLSVDDMLDIAKRKMDEFKEARNSAVNQLAESNI